MASHERLRAVVELLSRITELESQIAGLKDKELPLVSSSKRCVIDLRRVPAKDPLHPARRQLDDEGYGKIVFTPKSITISGQRDVARTYDGLTPSLIIQLAAAELLHGDAVDVTVCLSGEARMRLRALIDEAKELIRGLWMQ